MTADQLRKSILQRAIQGKLVPQDPNDESASVLVEKIREEKKRLVKEGKIKKSKNESIIFKASDNCYYEKFAGGTVKNIDEEIPFEIPESWEWVRLGSLMQKVCAGSTPRGGRNVYTSNGIKFIRSQNVYNMGLVLSNIAYITSEMHNTKSNSHVEANDLLLNITGASIGRCALVPENFDTANINQHILILRLLDYSIKKYIHTVLTSPLVFDQIMSLQVGGTKEGLSAEKANRLLIPIAPYLEQLRIVECINLSMSIVDKYQEYVKQLDSLENNLSESLKKSILQYAIQGKLVSQNPNDELASALLDKIREEKKQLIKEKKIKPDKHESFIFKGADNKYYERIGENVTCIDEEIPFQIPESWEWVRLGTLIDFRKNESIKSSFIPNESWILDLEDIEKDTGRLIRKKRMRDIKSKSNKHIFDIGNILYSKLRPYLNKVLIADEKGFCTTEILTFDFGEIYNRYAQIYLMSPFFVDYAMKEAYGVKMPRIGSSHGNNALMPIPPKEEQIRIATKLEKSLKRVKTLSKILCK